MAINKIKGAWTKNYKKTIPTKTRNKIFQKIIESKKSQEGLDSSFLNSTLRNISNFLGVFPQDYIENIQITTFPFSFVVNIDKSNQSGSHWIAINISNNQIYIFDSLGTITLTKPKFIFKFLSSFRTTHQFYVTPQLQNPTYYTCGFYCLYFLIACQFFSFNESLSLFVLDYNLNDSIILDLFPK